MFSVSLTIDLFFLSSLVDLRWCILRRVLAVAVVLYLRTPWLIMRDVSTFVSVCAWHGDVTLLGFS